MAIERSFAQHLSETAKLALPIAFSRVGMLLFTVTDTAFVGRISSTELAFFALANASFFVPVLFGIGLMTGTAVLAAQAIGAADDREVGMVWRTACCHAVLAGLIFWAFTFLAEDFFLAIGQAPDLAAGAARALTAMSAGIPAMLLFVASALWLEAMYKPRYALILVLLANGVNVVLNLLFTGDWIPGLADALVTWAGGAAAAAALATTIARWLLALALVAVIWWHPEQRRYQIRGPFTCFGAVGRKFRRLGTPYSIAQGLESAAFNVLVLIAGYLGTVALGSYQIVIQVTSLVFMAAIGIGIASSVKVGQAVGAGQHRDTVRAGWSGVVLIIGFMLIQSMVLVGFAEDIAGLFSLDTTVIASVAVTFLVVAVMLPFDGAQCVLMGAVRGTGDNWVPTLIQFVAFGAVTPPIAWLGAITFGFDVPGLMFGALSGTVVAMGLLGWRFHVRTSKPVQRF